MSEVGAQIMYQGRSGVALNEYPQRVKAQVYGAVHGSCTQMLKRDFVTCNCVMIEIQTIEGD